MSNHFYVRLFLHFSLGLTVLGAWRESSAAQRALPSQTAKTGRVDLYRSTLPTSTTIEEAVDLGLREVASSRGISSKDFQLLRATKLGSGKGEAFLFQQFINGLAVEGGKLHVFVSTSDSARSIYCAGTVTAAQTFQPDRITAETAQVSLRNLYPQLNEWSSPELVIFSGETMTTRAWKIQGTNRKSESYSFFVEASRGELLEARSEIYHVDISGQVQGKATPGLLPDSPLNPPVVVNLSNVPVSLIGGETVYTDSEGFFLLPYSGMDTVTLQANLSGPWVNVMNAQGAELSLLLSVLPPGLANFFFNADPTEFNTAQVNAFIHASQAHDFFKKYQPNYTGIDTPVTCNVNSEAISAGVWAWYDSFANSINFRKAEGSCKNTAYSTIIAHEYGHFIDDSLGGINSESYAFAEGFANSVSVMSLDTPVIGASVCSGNSGISVATNYAYPCPNPSLGFPCYLVLPGIWWDLKASLKQSLGNEIGSEIANQLFTDWALIATVPAGGQSAGPETLIEVYLADDDDGDLSNGTPHQNEICSAFGLHGFPCADCNQNGVPDVLDLFTQTSSDFNQNGIPDECEPNFCPWDLDGDETVGSSDLGLLLMTWGSCSDCAADFNNDGKVNEEDLAALMGAWGTCGR